MGMDFPSPDRATPEGLLAVGGDLSVRRLLAAYRIGAFPWFNEGQPILWWHPNPRMVLSPQDFRASRSLKKVLRSGQFTVTMDHAFRAVIESCAAPRGDGTTGTWITDDMKDAYTRLFDEGLAHSVEVWRTGVLVGGLYGVSLGRAFFGESMFSRETDASKVALAWLSAQLGRWSFDFIDCQLPTPHLHRLGARPIPRPEFLEHLRAALQHPDRQGRWQFGADLAANVAGTP